MTKTPVLYRKRLIGYIAFEPHGRYMIIPIGLGDDQGNLVDIETILYKYCEYKGQIGIYVYTKKRLELLKKKFSITHEPNP